MAELLQHQTGFESHLATEAVHPLFVEASWRCTVSGVAGTPTSPVSATSLCSVKIPRQLENVCEGSVADFEL